MQTSLASQNSQQRFSSLVSDTTAVRPTNPVDEDGYMKTTPKDFPRRGAVQDHRGSWAAPGSPSTEHAQFAHYDPERYGEDIPSLGYPPRSKTFEHVDETVWIPTPFRYYFWVPLVVFLVLGAVGLEIALYFSNKNQGWAGGNTTQKKNILHYLYTIPPVIIASIVVSMWAWTAVEVKRLQPYVDLAHGDAPPQRSLLLDYSRYNNLSVVGYALKNKHTLVVLASLMVLLSLAFQPLASALLVVKEVWWQKPNAVFQNLRALGLNQGKQFTDLTYFVTAAGYAGAAVMYNLTSPPFVHAPYTIGPFEMPTSIARNGTALVNTTAVKTETGCVPATVTMTKIPGGWRNMASRDGCSITFEVDSSSRDLFGSDGLQCGYEPQQFGPVSFWFFSYDPTPRSSVVFCSPKLSFWEVNAAVDIMTQNLSRIVELRPFDAKYSPYSSLSANVTGFPLNGRAHNGIEFNFTQVDPFVYARENATQLQLPAAVYQSARDRVGGYADSFDGLILADLTEKIYGMYLALLARELYFLNHNEPIVVQTRTFKSRVFLSDLAVHLLATALLVLAIMAVILHLLHREERQDLRLKHEPGTIASAVSFGAQTGVGQVLAGRQAERDIKDALRNKKFMIDPETMKIVMEGENGYESTRSPRPKSFIDQLLHASPSHNHATSRRSSRAPSAPDFLTTQRSPSYQPLNASPSPSAYLTVHTPH